MLLLCRAAISSADHHGNINSRAQISEDHPQQADFYRLVDVISENQKDLRLKDRF